MNKNHRSPSSRSLSAVEVKSKFGAEFRRFSLDRSKPGRYDEFYGLLQHVHRIPRVELLVGYADLQGDLLPINNDDNYNRALSVASPMLRLFLQRKEEADYSAFGTDSLTRKRTAAAATAGAASAVLSAVLLRPDAAGRRRAPPVLISLPRDFRPVSSIIDVDILPESHRRVRLYKHGQERPLGFYIRDGSSVRVTPHGLEKVPGIFISRMVPGGLAVGTGLLAVNDEVLEVNGIEVSGKSLDQVTDMMIANSHNLVVTVKPANQRNNVLRGGGGGGGGAGVGGAAGGGGGMSGSSGRSSDSGASYYGYGAASQAPVLRNFPAGEEELESEGEGEEGEEEEEEEEDLVIDAAAAACGGGGGGGDDVSDSVSVTALPRYEPHLDMRTAAAPAASNGGPAGHAHLYDHPPGVMFGSAPRLAASTPSPERSARRRRSLEEEGTVITL